MPGDGASIESSSSIVMDIVLVFNRVYLLQDCYGEVVASHLFMRSAKIKMILKSRKSAGFFGAQLIGTLLDVGKKYDR